MVQPRARSSDRPGAFGVSGVVFIFSTSSEAAKMNMRKAARRGENLRIEAPGFHRLRRGRYLLASSGLR